MTTKCIIPSCQNPSAPARYGMCARHYKRNYRHNDPHVVFKGGRKPIEPDVRVTRNLRMQELAKRRIQLGISVKSLSFFAGLNESTLRHYEYGDSSIGEAAILRYDRSLRKCAADLRVLLDKWGY